MKPKISVIMPVYNTPSIWLHKSIQSALNQTFKDFELIIIDDCSTNDSWRIIEKYQQKDIRIISLRANKNSGPGAARNLGLKKAKGEYIAISDSDDISLLDRLEKQFNFLEKHKDVFIVGTSVRFIDEKDHGKEIRIMPRKHNLIKKGLLGHKLAMAYPTAMFKNQGFLYREELTVAEDYDFYLGLLSRNKRFANLKKILLMYRVSTKSVSMNKKFHQVLFHDLAKNFYHERLEKGVDSYKKIQFNDCEKIIEFLGTNMEEIQKKSLEKQIVFALISGDTAIARKKFEDYKKITKLSKEKMALYFFVNFPFIHHLYRLFRYNFLRNLI